MRSKASKSIVDQIHLVIHVKEETAQRQGMWSWVVRFPQSGLGNPHFHGGFRIKVSRR